MLTFTDFVVATKNMDTVKTANSQEVEVLTGLPAMNPVNPGSMPVDLSLQEDLGLYLYRNPVTRQRVIDYFTGMTGSRQLTDIILRYSDINNLPLSLSFALAYAESSFNPSAVNRNSSSVDLSLIHI